MNGTTFRIFPPEFQTLEPLLANHIPATSNPMMTSPVYFLNRDAASFSAILYFLQHGELHMPPTVCPSVFKKELLFWGINWRLIKNCCLRKFVGFHDGEIIYTYQFNILDRSLMIRNGHIVNNSY